MFKHRDGELTWRQYTLTLTAPIRPASTWPQDIRAGPGRLGVGLGASRLIRQPHAGGHAATAAQRGLVAPDEFLTLAAEMGLMNDLGLLMMRTASAQLAAWLGRPYAFAAHFAPDLLEQAAEIYRSTFRPSPACPRPCASDVG